jgi:hypothetical protein
VVLPGLTGDNADPTGRDRRTHLRPLTPLTARFTAYLITGGPASNPAPGLRDIADDYAETIDCQFRAPRT